jgi:hypothetical protein
MKVDSKTSLVDNYRDDKMRALKSKELVSVTMISKMLKSNQKSSVIEAQNHFSG